MKVRCLASVLVLAALAPLVLPACEDAPPVPLVEVTPPPYGTPYAKLSDWHLFDDLAGATPAAHVLPYAENAPLFTDYTTKTRWVYWPPGAKATYSPDAAYELPVGAI